MFSIIIIITKLYCLQADLNCSETKNRRKLLSSTGNYVVFKLLTLKKKNFLWRISKFFLCDEANNLGHVSNFSIAAQLFSKQKSQRNFLRNAKKVTEYAEKKKQNVLLGKVAHILGREIKAQTPVWKS